MAVRCMGPGICRSRPWRLGLLGEGWMHKQLRMPLSFSRHLHFSTAIEFQRISSDELLRHHKLISTQASFRLQPLLTNTTCFFIATKEANGIPSSFGRGFKSYCHCPWSRKLEVNTLFIHWYIVGVEIGCHS